MALSLHQLDPPILRATFLNIVTLDRAHRTNANWNELLRGNLITRGKFVYDRLRAPLAQILIVRIQAFVIGMTDDIEYFCVTGLQITCDGLEAC